MIYSSASMAFYAFSWFERIRLHDGAVIYLLSFSHTSALLYFVGAGSQQTTFSTLSYWPDFYDLPIQNMTGSSDGRRKKSSSDF